MGLAGAAAITGVATVGGSLLQSNATSKAADKANAAQRQALDVARADVAPWVTAGRGALTGVQDASGLNGQPGYDAAMAAFHTSPGYGFALDQGLRAIDHGAAAKGILNSSDTLHQEQTFGTGLANKEFTDYYNRLFDLSKLGEGAASGSAAASQATGAGIAGTDVSSGAQDVSIYGNAAKGIGNSVNNYMNNSLYGGGGTNRLFGYGSDPSWASLNRTNPTVAPNTWSSQPDSYYLPGGGGYQI